MSFFSDAFEKVKAAGMETLEGIGEGAVAGITQAISGANPTAQQNNAPDIGETGSGRGTITTAPVGNLMPAPTGGAAGFISGMPLWAKVVGGASVLPLTGSLAVQALRGKS